MYTLIISDCKYESKIFLAHNSCIQIPFKASGITLEKVQILKMTRGMRGGLLYHSLGAGCVGKEVTCAVLLIHYTDLINL